MAKRLATIALGAGVTLALAAALAIAAWGRQARAEGWRRNFFYRWGEQRIEAGRRQAASAREHGGVQRLVWFGDSTMMGASPTRFSAEERRPVPGRVLRRLLRQGPVEILAAVAPAMDPYHFYFAAGPLLDQAPDLLVVGAHLRVLQGPVDQQRNDGCALIPLRELPRAMTLPLSRRGLTLGGLALCPLLRSALLRDAVDLSDGLRALFREADFWGPEHDIVARLRAQRAELQERSLRRYAAPLTPDLPMVRMLAAVIDMATRRHVPTLVFTNPIPHEAMRSRGLYDPDEFAARMHLLAEVVEDRGGHFVDLHDLLGSEDFNDLGGHFSPSGAEKVSERLAEEIQRMIERRAGGTSMKAAAQSRVTAHDGCSATSENSRCGDAHS